MVFNISGGGGEPFAVIPVEFPVGSTCTCTDPETGTTFTARSDANGKYIFRVPYAGSWNVTIEKEDGSESKTQTIVISERGVGKSIEMFYTADVSTSASTWVQGSLPGYAGNGFSARNLDDGSLYFDLTCYANYDDPDIISYGYNSTPIDLTNYDTLYINLSSVDQGTTSTFYLKQDYNFSASASAAVSVRSGALQYSVDVSGLTGPYYLCFLNSDVMGGWVKRYAYTITRIYFA